MKKKDEKTPGQILRDYRKSLELSTEDFAAKIEVAESTLRSLENGNRPITAEMAIQIEEKTERGLMRFKVRADLFVPKKAA